MNQPCAEDKPTHIGAGAEALAKAAGKGLTLNKLANTMMSMARPGLKSLIVEQYACTNDNLSEQKKRAQERFIKAVCERCTGRYQCITDQYKMSITEAEKFVLIRKSDKAVQVSCNYFNKID